MALLASNELAAHRYMVVTGTVRGAIAGASHTLILIAGEMIFGLD
jgi:hypothetical protein